MLNNTDIGGLDQFLRSAGSRIPRDSEPLLSVGTMLGSWCVASFIGRGGSGEVYRVVHAVTQTEAAAKVLIHDDPTHAKRFQDEIEFLSQNKLQQFPRYFENGEHDGHAYFILELLEPIDVPADEKEIADYLTEVCSCVRALHLSGIVHRDLKPKNIMRRPSGTHARTSVVLIDFGLAKDTLDSPRPRTDVSIVSGKAVGVGTPDYAAPEQLTGGEISPAADIHALGRIANAAFGGNPPRSWETIIRRATSSIPAQRYETVDDFVKAINGRNRLRNFIRVGLVAASLALVASVYLGRDTLPLVRDVANEMGFDAICKTVTTNIVTQQLLWQKYETNSLGMVYVKEWAYRNVTNTVDVTLVQLNRATNVFSRPMRLKSDHEYWVVGPGILDASVTSAKTNTTIRLKNCVFLNRSAVPLRETGIRYVFQGGAYLNFTDMDRPDDFAPIQLEGFDGAFDEVRFRGPETIKELNKLREKEMSEMLNRDTSQKQHLEPQFLEDINFLKFPREILPAKCEYTVESMKPTDAEKEQKSEVADFHLDPNRIRTNAEIQLFADVFSITFDEARQILKKAGRRCQS